jgi:hypothetical protein
LGLKEEKEKTGRIIRRKKELYRGLSFHPALFFFITATTLIITRYWPPYTAHSTAASGTYRDKEVSRRNIFTLHL